MSKHRPLEVWIAIVRLWAVPFAVVQVVLTHGYPANDRAIAWLLTSALAVAAGVLYRTVGDGMNPTFIRLAMLFDFGIVAAFVVLFSFEENAPTQELLFLAIVVGAARFGLRGGLVTAVAAVPVAAVYELLRSHHFDDRYRIDNVTFQAGAGVLMALVVGWLVARLDEQRAAAEQRAGEAEALRDELGRRADLLDAANRCARALSSSLDLDEAFGAFMRELRGLVPFDRVAIVLVEDGLARVIATAGEGADDVMPRGSQFTLDQSLLGELIRRGQPIVRDDIATPLYAEEPGLYAFGIRSRAAAPLLIGARGVGMIALSRREPGSFQAPEVELLGILGRLLASAVQNIRAYDAERRTVEELRRLSQLRADFVSLVSHELRSPMAAVIGAASTLQKRWADMKPAQREAFIRLIADETTRLAVLVGDVLDTSRIDAGTFSYRFGDVDLGVLVRESVAAAAMGQDEVPVVAEVATMTPTIHADGERLRQVVGNLIDNAVKYSPKGSPVVVHAGSDNGRAIVSVQDLGPGIAREHQQVIFEKFGRVAGASKPGTGLGLYIARSIAEAHGGELDVSSTPGRGCVFTLRLPTDPAVTP
jgi:signal transduction histidine kinase